MKYGMSHKIMVPFLKELSFSSTTEVTLIWLLLTTRAQVKREKGGGKQARIAPAN